ncbi:uncharacterized protein LOC124916135 [Impatiens glandulifera]|uniref:uncharacterized protein LOC124916135 n=1 Tax=Impatiens glandulifera TaxID=253017 RepID=UPI001FB07F09|nr:uncharacterized protein LOC124916135 [Impatiens glandulifera]
MLRAFSTRRYERLEGDGGGDNEHNNHPPPSPSSSSFAGSLKRVTSLPVKLLTSSSTRKLAPEPDTPVKQTGKQAKKAGNIHPLLSLFDPRRRKKATAKPEFARYLQYIKEGGVWNEKSDKPSIY